MILKKQIRTILAPISVGVLLFTPIAAYAAPGDLDATFGHGGIVVKRVMDIGHYSGPSSIKVQPDGKIIVSGQIDDYGDRVGYFIARFNADGSPDLSFGFLGIILPAMGYEGIHVGVDIAGQPDGKVVALGVQWDGNAEQIAVQRFDSAGEPDPSFGDGGSVVFTPPGMEQAGASTVILQPDGKIVIIGGEWSDRQFRGMVVRLNSDGSFDNSFGEAGIAANSHGAEVERAFVLPDGKFVIVGRRLLPTEVLATEVVVTRYNADGSPDSSFGANGSVIFSPNTSNALMGAGIQPGGKIVVGVDGNTNGVVKKALVRFNTDGSVDTTFAAASTFLSNQHNIYNLAFQSDGKIVGFGSSPVPGVFDGRSILVTRLHPNGSTDMSFGANGSTVTPIDSYPRYQAWHGAVQPDGKILALGTRGDYNVYEFALVRYLGDPPISISGLVTNPDGRGMPNVTVVLTNSAGERRRVITSSLGFYSFENLPVGETFTVLPVSKKYRFEPRTLKVDASLSNEDFVGGF